jgi:hypothetical protein
MQAPALMQSTAVLKEEKWAIFTEWKNTGYISNGSYAYTEERARELLILYKNENNKRNKDITRMWIQEKNTSRTLYK